MSKEKVDVSFSTRGLLKWQRTTFFSRLIPPFCDKCRTMHALARIEIKSCCVLDIPLWPVGLEHRSQVTGQVAGQVTGEVRLQVRSGQVRAIERILFCQ